MPKILLICRRNWNDLNLENLTLYSTIHFLMTYLNVEVIIHDSYDSLAENSAVSEVIGTLFHYQRYTDSQDMERIAEEVAVYVGPEKPFTAISNFLCSTPPPASAVVYDPNMEPLPTWLQSYFEPQRPIDIARPYLEIDIHRYTHHSQDAYQSALDRAVSMSRDERDSALCKSKYDGVGLGPWINTFLIEPSQLLSLINEPHGSHQVLHHSMQTLLRHHHLELLSINGITPQRYQFITGWLYRKTGIIEIPVLELAASNEDWNSTEFGPSLRRVAQWTHAQRQAIPILSDTTVITPEQI